MSEGQNDQQLVDALENAQELYDRYLELSGFHDPPVPDPPMSPSTPNDVFGS